MSSPIGETAGSLEEAVRSYFLGIGFKKKNKNLLYRRAGAILILAKITKPTFMVYVDLGLVFEEASFEEKDLKYPSEWHLTSELDSLFPSNVEILHAMMVDRPFTEGNRVAVIVNELERFTREILPQWESQEWLFEKAKQKFDPNMRIPLSFKRYVAEREEQKP